MSGCKWGSVLGGSDIILSGWGRVGKYFGWVGVGALLDNARIDSKVNVQ